MGAGDPDPLAGTIVELDGHLAVVDHRQLVLTDLVPRGEVGVEVVFARKDPAEYIKGVVDRLRAGELDDKLVYTKALRKSLDAYTKTTPPHVKAARLIDGPLSTNLIEYVVTVDGPEPVGAVQHSLDYEHYVDKQLRPVADAILVFYDTNMSDVLRGTQQKGLLDF